MIAPRLFRVLVTPTNVFRETMQRRRGYGDLFFLLGLEFVLIMPYAVVTHLMRTTYDPLSGLLGLWSAYVHFALRPAVVIFAAGIALYYSLRKTPNRLDLWTAASVIAYGWVPHTLLVALGVVLAGLGMDLPFMPHRLEEHATGWMTLVKSIFHYGPLIFMSLLSVRVCRLGTNNEARPLESSPSQRHHPSSLSSKRAFVLMGLSSLLILAAIGINANRVQQRWQKIRPVVPGDRVPNISLRDLNGTTGPALISWESKPDRFLGHLVWALYGRDAPYQ